MAQDSSSRRMRSSCSLRAIVSAWAGVSSTVDAQQHQQARLVDRADHRAVDRHARARHPRHHRTHGDAWWQQRLSGGPPGGRSARSAGAASGRTAPARAAPAPSRNAGSSSSVGHQVAHAPHAVADDLLHAQLGEQRHQLADRARPRRAPAAAHAAPGRVAVPRTAACTGLEVLVRAEHRQQPAGAQRRDDRAAAPRSRLDSTKCSRLWHSTRSNSWPANTSGASCAPAWTTCSRSATPCASAVSIAVRSIAPAGSSTVTSWPSAASRTASTPLPPATSSTR